MSDTIARTQRVSTYTVVGTLNANNFIDSQALFAGGHPSKPLVVIDWICYSATVGGANENWVLTINDSGGGNLIFKIQQTCTASTRDNIFLQFPTGLPLFTMSVLGSYGPEGTNVPVAIGSENVNVTGPTGSGTLIVGWHCEPAGERTL